MRVRHGLIVIAAAVVVFQAVVYAGLVISMGSTRKMQDFGLFYDDARTAIVERRNPYEVNASVRRNLNPPQFLLLLAPFVALDPLNAFVAWTALGVLSATAAVRLILREIGVSPTSMSGLGVIGFVIAGAPTGALLLSGQVSWLLWWPVARAWSAARRGQWLLAGGVLGVLASLKPFLLVLVPFLAMARRWRAMAVLVSSACACYALGIVLFGRQAFSAWLAGLGSIVWSRSVLNASTRGVVERALTNQPAPVWDVAALTVAPSLVSPIWIVASVAVLLATGFAILRSVTRSVDVTDRTFATGLTAALLVSPVGWVYYHFLFIGPVLALAVKERWWSESRLHRTLLVCFALPMLLSPGMLAAGQPNGWLSVTLGSLYFWSLLALWLATVWPLELADLKAGRPTPVLPP